MKGVVLPDRQEDFTADPVELFFDLAYVFAFSRLVVLLVHDPSWAGVGKAALLYVLMWFGWSQFTWSANAVSGNGRPIRVLFLIATAVSVPMAASIETAYGAGSIVFASGVVMIFIVGIISVGLGASSDSDLKKGVISWFLPNALAMSFVLGGAFLDGGGRIAMWIVAAALQTVSMSLAGNGDWIIRPGHFAERHALIIIVALGEVIVAVGTPVAAALTEGTGKTIIGSLAASSVFMGLLWWSYFDRPGPAIEYRAEQIKDPGEMGRFVRDSYTVAHAFIAAGVVAAAAGLEEIVLHPSSAVHLPFRMLLFGGLSMTLLGVAYSIWRSFKVIPPERMIMLGAIGLLLYSAAEMSGTTLLIWVDLIFITTLIFEHRRVEAIMSEANATALAE